MLQELFIVLCTAILYASGNVDEQQPVVIRLQPQRHKPTFLKSLTPPRSVPSAFSSSNANAASGANNVQDSDKQFGNSNSVTASEAKHAKIYSTQPAKPHANATPNTAVLTNPGLLNNAVPTNLRLPNPALSINQAASGNSPLSLKPNVPTAVIPGTQQSVSFFNPQGFFDPLTNRQSILGLPNTPQLTPGGLNPLLPPSAQQPVLSQPSAPGEQFTPREITTIPPPPPVNIPPDVQNQLIKFFGLDSFGIPGLTGNHPEGFAGAIEELRKAGIPIQGLPPEHLTSTGNNTDDGSSSSAHQSDAVARASPTFGNQLNQLYNEAAGPTDYHAGLSNIPLPEATPGENGLIGLLSSSVRKLVHDSGIADAMQQGLPTVLGTNKSPEIAHSTDGENLEAEAAASDSGIRRQQTVAQRALSGIAAALGGTAGNGPAHAGLPRIPGIPLLPGGIPRNAQGQIDVVQLIGSITRRITNGTTVADIIPPEQLQTLADNVTDALLPPTPEDFDLQKFMGRWFEGINSPRATEQRCIVHHYGGLTKNDKTATFTALKIYREGSEFGPVRYSIGYAFRGGNKHAMLQLHSSESADAQPFWIYKLGPEGTDPFGNPQYEWAIVSNWLKYPVTVLVRDPDKFKAKYEVEVLRWLEDQGFINGFVRAFNMLQPASYSSCQYADSTFTVFGPSKRAASPTA